MTLFQPKEDLKMLLIVLRKKESKCKYFGISRTRGLAAACGNN
jgi:hypothetical protein